MCKIKNNVSEWNMEMEHFHCTHQFLKTNSWLFKTKIFEIFISPSQSKNFPSCVWINHFGLLEHERVLVSLYYIREHLQKLAGFTPMDFDKWMLILVNCAAWSNGLLFLLSVSVTAILWESKLWLWPEMTQVEDGCRKKEAVSVELVSARSCAQRAMEEVGFWSTEKGKKTSW